MEFRLLDNTVAMPQLLQANGLLKLLPAADYDALPSSAIRLWCHKYARYGLPTTELVQWLQERIGARKTIEIGSGAGDLAYHLGIPATDSRLQERTDIRLTYQAMGQPVIQYPAFVQKLDALEAVEHHRPDVVIGSWVTEWIDPALPPPPHGGNAWGIKEDELLATGCTYILIGNRRIHGGKKIMRRPHEEYALPFLRSRASFPQFNRVWVWNGQG